MNLKSKLELLKNELESRNTTPDPNEIWTGVEQKLDARKSKKIRIVLSALALIVFTTVYIIVRSDRSQIEVSGSSGFSADTFERSDDNTDIQNDKNTLVQAGNSVLENAVQNSEVQVNESTRKIDDMNQKVMMKNTGKSRGADADFKNLISNRRNPGIELNDNKYSSTIESKNNIDMADNIVYFKDSGNMFNKISVGNPDASGSIQSVLKGNLPNSGMDTIGYLVKGNLSKDDVQDTSKKVSDQNSSIEMVQIKRKMWSLRPYFGFQFNQLEPFSVPGKHYAYSLLSNYNAGLLVDRKLNERSMVTLNLGFIRMPSKIEILQSDINGSDQIVKVLNTNNLIMGIEYTRFNVKRNLMFNIGHQLAYRGNISNYVIQKTGGGSEFFQQKKLPGEFLDTYYSKWDALVNAGVTILKGRTMLRFNYYQGLVDVSKASRLFNPHTFVQVQFAYRLLEF